MRILLTMVVLTVGCAHTSGTSVLQQAPPNTFLQRPGFAIDEIAFDGMKVDEQTESEWLAKKDAGQRASFEADKRAMTGHFVAGLTMSAPSIGVTQAGQRTPFRVRARVSFLQPGFYGWSFVKQPTTAHMNVEVLDERGQLLELLEIAETVSASRMHIALGSRMRAVAERLGHRLGAYLLQRVYPGSFAVPWSYVFWNR